MAKVVQWGTNYGVADLDTFLEAALADVNSIYSASGILAHFRLGGTEQVVPHSHPHSTPSCPSHLIPPHPTSAIQSNPNPAQPPALPRPVQPCPTCPVPPHPTSHQPISYPSQPIPSTHPSHLIPSHPIQSHPIPSHPAASHSTSYSLPLPPTNYHLPPPTTYHLPPTTYHLSPTCSLPPPVHQVDFSS